MCKNLFGEESKLPRHYPPQDLDGALGEVQVRASRVQQLIDENRVTWPAIKLSAFSFANALQHLERHLADKTLVAKNRIAVSRIHDALRGLWQGFDNIMAGEFSVDELADFRCSRNLLSHCAAL